MTKEYIYLAVSITNNCEYCIHSHIAAARKKGMDDEMLAELVEIVALANAGNRLTRACRWRWMSGSSRNFEHAWLGVKPAEAITAGRYKPPLGDGTRRT